MKKLLQILAGAMLLTAFYGMARVGIVSGAHPPATFTVAAVHFEQNATDGDVEVVFEAKGRAEGLAKLTVLAPNGRTVVDFTAPEASSTLGMRQFRFESPEPKDVASLKSAYPEGEYIFEGTTTSGAKLHGKSTLHHRLPEVASFVQPAAEAGNVPLKGLKITWTPAENATSYVVYIEQGDLNVELTAKLPGSANSLNVPDGFLVPETEYTLGIGTMTSEGNTSYIETSFVTAKK